MSGYDIDDLGPGAGGSAADAWAAAQLAGYDEDIVVDDAGYLIKNLHGWSLQNTAAGLSTVYIRFGNSAAATPFIAINLAENETITQIFDPITIEAAGIFVTVEVGTVDGILYTS